MSSEDSPSRSLLEAHESFIEHVEAGRSRIRLLSVITIVVAFLLIASYFSQLLLPYTSGTRYVQVDLLNPALIVTQILLIILVGAWLYVGVVNYLFATRLGKSIREIRAQEREIEKRITG